MADSQLSRPRAKKTKIKVEKQHKPMSTRTKSEKEIESHLINNVISHSISD